MSVLIETNSRVLSFTMAIERKKKSNKNSIASAILPFDHINKQRIILMSMNTNRLFSHLHLSLKIYYMV